ncbi:hypothetical protein niasHS_002741 [Heterodera schachtii]|uniref:non-specific serine/threonine protein kinase n=1 Tax=Heterodera schachtii TaxID=97005 RepID=A0ABD2K2A7_HETSC
MGSEKNVQKDMFYVFQLPAKIVCEISNALDTGNCWEAIAFSMPGIRDIDIDACRRLTQLGDHPTETLLRIWGSKGYTVLDLYKIFYRTRLLRCMQILLPFVDKQFHHFVKLCSDESIQSQNQRQLSLQRKSSSIHKSNTNASVIYSNKKKVLNRLCRVVVLLEGFRSMGSPNLAEKATDSLLNGLQNTPAVTYEDLTVATDGFSPNKIVGRGGYGVVYRGVWKHTPVAIKRIQGKSGSDERQQRERIRQSLQELKTLAKFRHDNVLSLYGYSLDGPEPCLVYQFMSNGTLEDRLLCRLSICGGVCRGLHFLHTINQMPIIHGDVKSANILLDKHFDPKLGDFGLSRDGQVELDTGDKRPMIASHVKGTLAYLAPEFLTSRILTTKLDVFSFGVVLLEVSTGQRAFSASRNPQGIVEFVLKMCTEEEHKDDTNSENKCYFELADKRTPKTDDDRNLRIFNKLLSVGISCTEKDRFVRPIFSEIFARLNDEELQD